MTPRNILYLTCAVTITACSPGLNINEGQYWQRISTSEAIYAQGPKAQEMLNRDIGRCVVEMRELERLGTLRNAIPVDSTGKVLDPDQQKVADWDTPDHDGALMAEHTDYENFDGCMKAKGWERIKYVPFDVAERARHNYYLARADFGYDPQTTKKPAAPDDYQGDYSQLND